MGQYYNILTYKNNKYKVYDRSIKENEKSRPEYMMAKIMEHSWLGNSTMMSFSNLIYNNPTKVAWVGDYSDEITKEDINNKDLTLEKAQELHLIAWHENKELSLIYKEFKTDEMILVNWDKKQYLAMNEYIEKSTTKEGFFEGWCIHPLSLLTALGNGFGGGDYHGINEDKVGSWCFDTLSYESYDIKEQLDNDGFRKFDIEFRENCQ